MRNGYAASAPGWLASLHHDDPGEADAFGISNGVYRSRRPFHPQRFWDLLHDETAWRGVLRGKGFFWLAPRNDLAGTLSQAGTDRPGHGGLPSRATRGRETTRSCRSWKRTGMGIGVTRRSVIVARNSC